MSDQYARFARWKPGRFIVHRLGLPDPPLLRRHDPAEPLGPILLGGAGRLIEPASKLLPVLGTTGDTADTGQRFSSIVYDASALADTGSLRSLYHFFAVHVRSLADCGRVVVLGTPPQACLTVAEATAQQAIEGFVRALAKELGHGSTAQLVLVTPGAEAAIESTLRFLLSGRSAYVSGQVIRVGPAIVDSGVDWDRPLNGRVAVVTGAAQGIGATTAEVLARDGAHVVCVDVPATADQLSTVASRVGGTDLQLDLTEPDAPRRLADFIATRHVHADVFVHNAGITRDRRLSRMSPGQWDAVLAVNLASQERINEVFLSERLLGGRGRIVAVSSVVGIAGNPGQTNYATSKAGVIGWVRALAPVVAAQGMTVNAVAPGFIETRMTARVPVVVREMARRMNSLAQGGLPVDVAETIAWLASPASGGVTGNVVRVCGQSLVGA